MLRGWTPRASSRIFTSHTVFRIGRRNQSNEVPHTAGLPDSVSAETPIARTALYELHKANGGKMVPFGGYELPIQYDDLSIKDSHLWTRSKASLFDVGHMVQHNVSGPGAARLLESITPLSTTELQPGSGSLSCILHEHNGGIVDDTIITRLGPEEFYMVTNAACREKVSKFIKSSIDRLEPQSVRWHMKDEWGLMALQGPLSSPILQEALQSSSAVLRIQQLYFGHCQAFDIPEIGITRDQMLVSRGGYTGEDGFEISVHPDHTLKLAKHLLSTGGPERLRFAGLAARDSLRLEAGMCLYGHDLDDTTTPVEAGLAWTVSRSRRQTDSASFNGHERILQQLRPRKAGGGVDRRRVGLIVNGAPAREGAVILSAQGETIGKVTSGCPSPSLNENIAMGYVAHGFEKADTQVQVLIRGKQREAKIVRMPFVPSKYYKQQDSMS